MFRTPQTRILLSDYEVLQTIHSICTQRFMTPNLPYCPPVSKEDEDEDEDEAEFYQDSLSTSYPRSSSAGYSMSDHDRYACDLLKRYRDSKTYFNSSASDDLPAYSAGPHATLDTRPVDHSESYQSEGTFIPEDRPSQP